MIDLSNLSDTEQHDFQEEAFSGSHQSDGSGKGWEAATALLNTAGQVIAMIDSNGNHIDPATVTHVQTDEEDNTIYYILGAVVFVVFILILFMIAKKK